MNNKKMDNKKVNTINEYVESFPSEVQEIIEKIRQTIKKTASPAAESIAYGMMAYKLNGRPLVYFAAFKKHIGFYPLPLAINNFQSDIAKYKHAKGSVQFPLNEPIPYDLIEKIVKFRIKDNSK